MIENKTGLTLVNDTQTFFFCFTESGMKLLKRKFIKLKKKGTVLWICLFVTKNKTKTIKRL